MCATVIDCSFINHRSMIGRTSTDLTWRMAVSLTPKGGKEAVGVARSGHRIAIADELIDLASQIRAIVGCP